MFFQKEENSFRRQKKTKQKENYFSGLKKIREKLFTGLLIFRSVTGIYKMKKMHRL